MKPRKRIPRGEPPKRVSRLPKQAKRIRARGRKRFPKGYDKAYRAYVASLPCLLYGEPEHLCTGQSEPAHVHADATGVGDRGQLIPLCASAHRLGFKNLHDTGRHSFPTVWGLGSFITLEKLAADLWTGYAALHPAGGVAQA